MVACKNSHYGTAIIAGPPITNDAGTSSSRHENGLTHSDTLFLAGCGRFFEGESYRRHQLTTGNAAEMHAALTKLGRLPDDTLVYNGHEYTSGSAKFGLTIEPENADLKKWVTSEAGAPSALRNAEALTLGCTRRHRRTSARRASRLLATRRSGTCLCVSTARRRCELRS